METDRNGEVKTNRKGEAKVAVDNIAKGILKDGQNFKMNENTVSLGGDEQPNLEQVEYFITAISNYTGVEISGAYLSTENSINGEISKVLIDEYNGNTRTESLTTINRKQLQKDGLYTNTHFHTHPETAIPSITDKNFRDAWLQYKGYHKFKVLANPFNNKTVISKDYTNDK